MEHLERLYRLVLSRVGRHPRARPAVLGIAVFVRELIRDRVPVRAATLSYWSLVTIVPVLVLIAAVVTPLTPEGSQPFHEVLLRAVLAEPVRGVGDTVESWLVAVDLNGLGVIGVVSVLFTSSRIYFSVEDAYNSLWNTRARRSWLMRMVLFYTTVTLGPLLITLGFQLSDAYAFGVAEDAEFLLPTLVTAVAFVALLRVLPDTEVRWGPAIIGGVASAVAFELAKRGFALYVRLLAAEDKAAQIYGAVWIFPVFLLWLYLLWLIVLLGVELAYVVQRRDDLLVAEERALGGEAEERRHADALFALQCALVVADRYAQGLGPTPEPLVTHALTTDPAHVRSALEALEDAGVLAESPHGYLPALPPALLTVREVLVRYRERTRPATGADAPGNALVERILAPGFPELEAPLARGAGSGGSAPPVSSH